jgi:hypothetical protein
MRRLAAVAALGDVMRDIRDHEARKTSHARPRAARADDGNYVSCPWN